MAIRDFKRAQDLEDTAPEIVARMLREAGLTPETAEAIYRMTALATTDDRYVLPPIQREEYVDGFDEGPAIAKGEVGLGFVQIARRGA